MSIGQDLVAQFAHMARRDGGSLSLLGEDDHSIRVGYRMGADVHCEDGSCVLPHQDLELMMNEIIGRRHPALKVTVQLVTASN